MSRTMDSLVGKCRNRVHRVGIELEGGWAKLPPGTRLAHDGSVFRNTVVPATVAHSGEIASPPMPLSDMEAWVKRFHPSHVDKSCGLHIHMSFRSALHYQRLMVKDFTTELIEGIRKWAKEKKISIPSTHPLWDRLDGKNEFCLPQFYADQQVKSRSKSYNHNTGGRYTWVNYCYGLHNTIEVRGLPMFETPELSIEALNRVIALTNAFLILQAKREPIHQETVNVDLSSSLEHFQEYL